MESSGAGATEVLCAEPQHGQPTLRKPGSRSSTVSSTWEFRSKEHLQSHTCQLPLRPTAGPGSFILNTCFPAESLESGAGSRERLCDSTQQESWAWSPPRASHDVIRQGKFSVLCHWNRASWKPAWLCPLLYIFSMIILAVSVTIYQVPSPRKSPSTGTLKHLGHTTVV